MKYPLQVRAKALCYQATAFEKNTPESQAQQARVESDLTPIRSAPICSMRNRPIRFPSMTLCRGSRSRRVIYPPDGCRIEGVGLGADKGRDVVAEEMKSKIRHLRSTPSGAGLITPCQGTRPARHQKAQEESQGGKHASLGVVDAVEHIWMVLDSVVRP